MSKTKDIIGSFGSFATKYGEEANLIAGALTAILDAVRPNNDVSAQVRTAVKRLEAAGKALADAPKITKITVNKSDIEAAVAKVLPSLLNDIVTEAVTKALADAAASDATESGTDAN